MLKLRYLPLVLLLSSISRGTTTRDSCVSCSGEAKLDLFKLFTNSKRPEGFSATAIDGAPRKGDYNENEPSYAFNGNQWMMDTGTVPLNQVVCGMCSRHEVTFLATVYFTAKDAGGPLLEMSYDNTPAFTIRVNSKGNELSVFYLHQHKIVVEKFQVQFELGKHYKIAIQFNGNSLKLFVNCELLVVRLSLIPDYCMIDQNVIVTVGGDTVERYYTGSLEGVRIVISDKPLETQCPNIESDKVECPICGSMLSTMINLKSLQEQVRTLEDVLNTTVYNNQNCDSSDTSSSSMDKKCDIDGSIYSNGDFALTRDGNICFCQNGEATCKNQSLIVVAPAPTTVSTSTAIPSPTSAPSTQKTNGFFCGDKTIANKMFQLKLGEVEYTKDNDKCIITTCNDSMFGGLTYYDSRVSCDSVSTDCNSIQNEEQRNISICCSRCEICNFITCPTNSECKPVPPNFECQCNSGFAKADGICNDINECLLPADNGGHDCPTNSTCDNSIGSFDCQCEEFFKIGMVDGLKKCVDIDECSAGAFDCPTDTTCVNRDYGYDCQCNDGFILEVDKCIPVCDPICKFGECVANNTCECYTGFTGSQCEMDINECETSNPCEDPSGEVNITTCTNTHGGFFCSCIEGLYHAAVNDGFDLGCRNVRECELNIHLCPEKSTCRDYPDSRGYRCECDYGNCDGNCLINDGTKMVNNGDQVINGCVVCRCKDGNYNCDKIPCDCTDQQSNPCCPECSRKDYCYDNEIPLRVGKHQYVENCKYVSCERSENDRALLTTHDVECPTLHCPLDKTYTSNNTCCPVCALNNCTSAINGRTVRIKNSSNNCDICTCSNSDEWSCTSCQESQDYNCPPLDDCPAKHVVQLSSIDCPVCLSSSDNICTS